MAGKEMVDEIKKLKSIADIGLLYSNSDYDRERYTEIQKIAFRLFNKVSGHSVDDLQNFYLPAKDYPTAKVDIRGLVVSKDRNKILLARESIDGKWSLPGGWADIGYSPKEIIIKEFKEETGLDVMPTRLLAVFDTRLHHHPPEPFYVYKLVFYCEAISDVINNGFDILDVQYFYINQLPALSENRILESQIEFLYDKIITSDFNTYFD
jgi:ADP-ribose pyrophosphatase YjhB (NUDIX family)